MYSLLLQHDILKISNEFKELNQEVELKSKVDNLNTVIKSSKDKRLKLNTILKKLIAISNKITFRSDDLKKYKGRKNIEDPDKELIVQLFEKLKVLIENVNIPTNLNKITNHDSFNKSHISYLKQLKIEKEYDIEEHHAMLINEIKKLKETVRIYDSVIKIKQKERNDLINITKNIINYDDKHKIMEIKMNVENIKLNKLVENDKLLNEQLKALFMDKKKEYLYVDDMSKEYLKILKEMNWVVIDPGNKTILKMLSKDGKTSLSYNKKEHLFKTKYNKYRKQRENMKVELKINEEMVELSKVTKGSTSYKIYEYMNYLLIRDKNYETVRNKYKDDRFYKLRWYSYINKNRTYADLISSIKKKFGKNAILILGDWSMEGHFRGSRAPNKFIKELLKKHFITLNIDEYRTSILHNKEEVRCENFIKKHSERNLINLEKIKEKNQERYTKILENKKVHSVLTYTIRREKNGEIVRFGCINRDNNSVKNMLKIVNDYIECFERKGFLLRGTKVINLSNRLKNVMRQVKQ